MKHTEETIIDKIIDASDIIRSIWRGWENQAKQKIIDDKAWRAKVKARHPYRVPYKISYSYESPQERGARMRAHNDCIQANGYGSSYF